MSLPILDTRGSCIRVGSGGRRTAKECILGIGVKWPDHSRRSSPHPRKATTVLENLDLRVKLSREESDQRLGRARSWLLKLQRTCWREGVSALIAFEGWDAAGKGSSIRALTRRLEPRGFELHPIREPRTLERQMPWLWRFWQKVPTYGSWAVFDRSWYGRVLVDRVEGLVDDDWQKTYRQINDFERALADDRYVVIKFFLHISKREQKRRFRALESDPLTAWQVEAEDWKRHEKYDEYLAAAEEMLAYTETEWAPWTIVAATDRRWTRMKVLDTVVEQLENGLVARGIALPSDDDLDFGHTEEDAEADADDDQGLDR